jgi:N-acetyl-anhydromuramyl-L-alanine amidase AmpD
VKLAIHPEIERGRLSQVNGIIVHQTGAPTAKHTLNSYARKGANGAHFLIDKDGTIYQTASVRRATSHVGHLQARCLVELRCTKDAFKGKGIGKGIGRIEAEKEWPDRYPGNFDSLGIEIVGQAFVRPDGKSKNNGDDKEYEPVTGAQQESFTWLLQYLKDAFGVRATEVFRHPTVSWKNPSEAASVQW